MYSYRILEVAHEQEPVPGVHPPRSTLAWLQYSNRKTYLHWIKRFILFHQRRHPAEMGAPEVRVFLTSLANDNGVSVNTQ
ncbi:site-specific integrase [Halomonas sp. H10-59]|uniref:site-specific integrase n=1 Tax=Halomonas sp. H10-59 TaxID=2950874 RepID=UPI0032B4626E